MKPSKKPIKGVRIATIVFILAIVVILVNGASMTSRQAANQSTDTNSLISLIAVFIGMSAGVFAIALNVTNRLHRSKPTLSAGRDAQEKSSNNSRPGKT